MIRLYAIAALLAASLFLFWNGQRLTHRADAAERALAGATARLAQVEVARVAHERYVAAAASLSAAYDTLTAEVAAMEGADAPLSDYLRAVDQRLR
jgi:hypothetical protein